MDLLALPSGVVTSVDTIDNKMNANGILQVQGLSSGDPVVLLLTL